MRKTISIFVLVTMLISLSISLAHARETNIYERFQRQQNRIDQGVNEGLLRRNDAEQLRHNVYRIQHEFERTWREGYLNHRAMERFNRELDENSRRIERAEHRGGDWGHSVERFQNRQFNEYNR